MAVTAKMYAYGLANAYGGTASGSVPIDFLSDTIKCALTTSTFVPTQATNQWFSDVTNEVSGTGYSAGGAALASKTVAVASLVATLGCANVSWTTSTITARIAVIYKDTGTAGTSPLIGYIDFGADVISSAGTFQITINGSGLATVTAS